MVPVWSREAIRVQPVRSGFPCFGAAIIGYVEATRHTDDEKNLVCPSSSLPDTTTSWARMQVLGSRAAQAFGAQPDVKTWANQTTLNPGRIPAERVDDPLVVAAQERIRTHAGAAMTRLTEFAGLSGPTGGGRDAP